MTRITHYQGPQFPMYYGSSSTPEWMDVTARGVGTLIALGFISLFTYLAGIALVKSALATILKMSETAFGILSSASILKIVLASCEGVLTGLIVLYIRRWRANVKRLDTYKPVIKPQVTPALVVGLVVGLLCLSLNLSPLQDLTEGAQVDSTTGIPAILSTSGMLKFGGGGEPPEVNAADGYGTLLAVLLLLLVFGFVSGWLTGAVLGMIGLGAITGTAQELTLSMGYKKNITKEGWLKSSLSAAATGSFTGATAAVFTLLLTAIFAGAGGDELSRFIIFDIIAGILTFILFALIRPSFDNPKGLIGNLREAATSLVTILFYLLTLVICLGLLAVFLGLFFWLLSKLGCR